MALTCGNPKIWGASTYMWVGSIPLLERETPYCNDKWRYDLYIEALQLDYWESFSRRNMASSPK